LQRQILHNEHTVGLHKAISAAQAIKKYAHTPFPFPIIRLFIITRLNHRINVEAVTEILSSSNAVSLLSSYDVILDCTDNSPTRYLLSDTAVYLGKPLVSGAAQKYDGQLCTYNLGEDGPCYRCLFPKPPAQEMTGTCEETGILGVVTGVIGNMQALETIKIITGLHGKSFLL
jgi:adenylyltransferase/sulfurtransferase